MKRIAFVKLAQGGNSIVSRKYEIFSMRVSVERMRRQGVESEKYSAYSINKGHLLFIEWDQFYSFSNKKHFLRTKLAYFDYVYLKLFSMKYPPHINAIVITTHLNRTNNSFIFLFYFYRNTIKTSL